MVWEKRRQEVMDLDHDVASWKREPQDGENIERFLPIASAGNCGSNVGPQKAPFVQSQS